MTIIGLLAIPTTLIQYKFSRERVTEDNQASTQAEDAVSFYIHVDRNGGVRFGSCGKRAAQMQADILQRHKAAAAARGEVYVSPEEKAALEQAELDRVAEENRIKELKAHCAKKGLNFEAEEAKYQQKLAERRAKEAAKAKKVRK